MGVNTTNNSVIAQGGCIWEDVDAEAAKYNLATGISKSGSMHVLMSSWGNGQ